MKVCIWPSKVLREKARPLVFSGRPDAETIDLVWCMVDVMYAYKGLGLAAPQIGESKQVFVADKDGDPLIAINPVIVSRGGSKVLQDEGCLSVINFGLEVERSETVVISAVDENGQRYGLEAEGMLARVIQHEMDHLNGKLIFDYASSLKQRMYKKKINKILKRRGLDDMPDVRISHKR